MVKKVLSLILCLAMLLSCFSAAMVSASAAVVSAKSLFTVSTSPVDNNKLTYKISVTANQKNIAGTIIVVEYDSTVLKPVNCGPAMRTNSTEGTVQNFEGNFVHGVTELDKNMYSIAYMNTLSVSTSSTASDFFNMQFEIIDDRHPLTDIRFYCRSITLQARQTRPYLLKMDFKKSDFLMVFQLWKLRLPRVLFLIRTDLRLHGSR